MNDTVSRDLASPPAELLTALSRCKRPLVVGHVTPDADCVGSGLGLCAALRARGVNACFALPGGKVSNRLGFLLDIAGRELITGGTVEGHDALIALDTAGSKRLNGAFAFDSLNGLAVLNIDHHVSNPGFGQVNWIDPEASSTSEMIHRLLVALRWPTSAAVASLLYAGIHGDTAGFSLPTTTGACLHSAAELVRAGADVGMIGEKLCRSQVRADFELLRRVYDQTLVTSDGRIAYSTLSYADITEAGCTAEDIDDQVSIPRSLAGIRIAMLFSEGEPDVIRINFRGEGSMSVLPLAQRFNGGGHAQSAGARIKGEPMQQVVDNVLAAAHEHLNSLAKA